MHLPLQCLLTNGLISSILRANYDQLAMEQPCHMHCLCLLVGPGVSLSSVLQMRSKTVDPVWDEVLEFETTDLRRTLEQPLRLQVVNHHRLRKGDDLGTANLDLRVLASYCPEALPHSVAHVPHTVVAGETLYEGWYASFERVTTAACKCSPRRPLLPTGTRASRGCRCIGRAAAARA